jgi:hypothetical protein
MGWFRPSLGALDRPDVDRVNDASRLTQDLILTDDNRLGGYVICYKPNVGGMVLIDPDQPLEDVHVIHVLVGDLQNQQRIKTINRRRLADWRQAGQSFASGGDMDMARLFWKAEEQVDTSGFVDDPTVDKIFKQLRARELVH